MRTALLLPLAAFAAACAPAPVTETPATEVDVAAPAATASATPTASSAPLGAEEEVDAAEAADAEAAFRATEQAEQRQKLEELIASGALEAGQGPTGAGFGKLGGPGLGAGTAAPSPVAQGSLPKEVVQRVVRRHLPAIQACYERFLGPEPTLAGRVVMRIVIGGDGKVSAASVANSTLGHAKVEACLVGVAQAWAFPAPQGNAVVVVNYPFTFQPSPDGPSGGSAPLTPGPSGP